jgi:hypothetical protein
MHTLLHVIFVNGLAQSGVGKSRKGCFPHGSHCIEAESHVTSRAHQNDDFRPLRSTLLLKGVRTVFGPQNFDKSFETSKLKPISNHDSEMLVRSSKIVV